MIHVSGPSRSLLVAALLLFSGLGWSQTTTLLPLTDDAWIKGSQPDRNTGAETRVTVGKWGPKDGLVRFDSASIAGQTISQATLELYLSGLGSPGTLNIHPISSSWSEGSVTWNTRPPAESQALASIPVSSADVGTFLAIDVTAIAQRWADGTLADAGFELKSSTATVVQFHTKETGGGNPATLTVTTQDEPPPPTGGPITLDLSPDALPLVIDEPGFYVLDQDWEIFGGIPAVGPPIISITSDSVTLDLRGFAIRAETQRRLLEITGGNVQIRNGTLTNVEADEAPIVGGSGVTLDNVTAGGRAGIDLGINSVVRNSDISGWLSVGDGSIVRDNTITCSFACVTGGSATRIIGNDIKAVSPAAFPEGGEAIRIQSGSTVRHNEIRLLVPGQDAVGIGAYGDANIISSNVLVVEDGAVGIVVDGDRSHLDSNVLLRTFEPGPQIGIEFRKDGNFYGDNRMSATVPFELGGTVQTDWGGNVGF